MLILCLKCKLHNIDLIMFIDLLYESNITLTIMLLEASQLGHFTDNSFVGVENTLK